MPVKKCSNGKYRIGSGPCIYKSKKSADKAYRAYLAKNPSKSNKKSPLVETPKGEFIFPSDHKKVTDGLPHFAINSLKQATVALERVKQYDNVPPWFKGSMRSFSTYIHKAVAAQFPQVSEKNEKYEMTKSSYIAMLRAEEKEGVSLDWTWYAKAAKLMEKAK